MAYVGNDPFQNKSVDTAQLADNAVTNEKIVDDITFDDITTEVTLPTKNICFSLAKNEKLNLILVEYNM